MSESNPRVYLDYAASTPVLPEVVEAMRPYQSEYYANAGGIHKEGVAAANAILAARKRVADILQVKPGTITFTSGGTESNNLAVFGFVRAYCKAQGKSISEVHLITTAVEHSSVLDCFLALQEEGAQLTLLPVDRDGRLDPGELEKALTSQTVLVSTMYANSEMGVIYPLRELGQSVRRYRAAQGSQYPLLHTDASQIPCYLPCQIDSVQVDAMTLDAQKIYGPKGVGCLYHAPDAPITPLLVGGGQEQGLRPGTVPTPLVVGMAEALAQAEALRDSEIERLSALRDRVVAAMADLPGIELNGHPTERVANNLNFSIPGKLGEQIVLELDMRGFATATKSVCKGAAGPSHVIAALGKGDEYATSAVRISLGRYTDEGAIDRLIQALQEIAA